MNMSDHEFLLNGYAFKNSSSKGLPCVHKLSVKLNGFQGIPPFGP